MRIFNVDITEFRVITAMDGVADLLRTKGPELGRAYRLKTGTGRRWVSIVRGHARRWDDDVILPRSRPFEPSDMDDDALAEDIIAHSLSDCGIDLGDMGFVLVVLLRSGAPVAAFMDEIHAMSSDDAWPTPEQFAAAANRLIARPVSDVERHEGT